MYPHTNQGPTLMGYKKTYDLGVSQNGGLNLQMAILIGVESVESSHEHLGRLQLDEPQQRLMFIRIVSRCAAPASAPRVWLGETMGKSCNPCYGEFHIGDEQCQGLVDVPLCFTSPNWLGDSSFPTDMAVSVMWNKSPTIGTFTNPWMLSLY